MTIARFWVLIRQLVSVMYMLSKLMLISCGQNKTESCAARAADRAAKGAKKTADRAAEGAKAATRTARQAVKRATDFMFRRKNKKAEKGGVKRIETC